MRIFRNSLDFRRARSQWCPGPGAAEGVRLRGRSGGSNPKNKGYYPLQKTNSNRPQPTRPLKCSSQQDDHTSHKQHTCLQSELQSHSRVNLTLTPTVCISLKHRYSTPTGTLSLGTGEPTVLRRALRAPFATRLTARCLCEALCAQLHTLRAIFVATWAARVEPAPARVAVPRTHRVV